MRRIILLFAVGILQAFHARASDTNLLQLATSKYLGREFVCTASEKQLLSDKKWDVTTEPIPLDPKKAFEIASPWALQESTGGKPSLVGIEILSLFSLTHSPAYAGHYCYVVEFGCVDNIRGFYRSAVVLLDGTLIKPYLKPMPMP